MNYNQRKAVIDKLNYLEQKFPVEQWKLEGIHIWPILKVKLFFGEFNKQHVKQTYINEVPLHRKLLVIPYKIKRLLRSMIGLAGLKLPKVEFVFSGAHSHRVLYNGKFINRYFDPMIEYMSKKDILTIGMEYNSMPTISNSYVKLDTIVPLFRSSPINMESLRSENYFLDFMEEVESLFNIKKPLVMNNLSKAVSSVLQWKKLYLYVFKKTRPKYCFGLCYYSAAMWGMNAAARELDIVSVDMQHGTQGPLHAAYSFFKLPKEGYNVLPQEFWCWDKNSCQHLLTWIDGSSHKAKLSGNPWYEFLGSNTQAQTGIFPQDKPVILYTYQPLKPLIDDYLIEAIKKTKQNYYWWIRLHPRITDEERTELLKILKDNDVLSFVELDKASKIPLPTILSACSLHISKFSGSIIEAASVGTISVILEEIGINTFKDVIESGKAIGLKDPTTDSMIRVITQALKMEPLLAENITFKDLMDDVLQ